MLVAMAMSALGTSLVLVGREMPRPPRPTVRGVLGSCLQGCFRLSVCGLSCPRSPRAPRLLSVGRSHCHLLRPSWGVCGCVWLTAAWTGCGTPVVWPLLLPSAHGGPSASFSPLNFRALVLHMLTESIFPRVQAGGAESLESAFWGGRHRVHSPLDKQSLQLPC